MPAIERSPLGQTTNPSKTVVSLFSGAGGMSLGFKRAGLCPSVGVELDRDACATYESNLSTPCINQDISSPNIADTILSEIGNTSKVFAVIGGPPCQGFSTAGSREANDPRNKLIFSYLSIVGSLRPSWVFFENVEGLLTSNGGRSVRDFVAELIRLGYCVSVSKINFAALGLPQGRKRVLIVANDLGIDYHFPEQSHSFEGRKHRSANGFSSGPALEDALAGLGNVVNDIRALSCYGSDAIEGSYDDLMRRGNKERGVHQHYSQGLSAADQERASLLKPGQTLRDLPEELWPDSYRSRAFRRVADGMPTEKRGGAPAGLKRLESSHASLTITSLSSREFIHPWEDRPLSLRECARIQSFPDNFIFQGNGQSIARQIGNAFPPLAAEACAVSLLSQTGKIRSRSQVKPGLIRFRLTDSAGRSPALVQTEVLLEELQGLTRPNQIPLSREFLEGDPLSKLDANQKALITSARRAIPVVLSDREMARLVSVMLHDIGRDDLIPTFVGKMPDHYQGYYNLPLPWFTSDENREFDFADFFQRCESAIESFDTIFECLCQIHKRRRKYDLILRGQPRPTMDQVARKGLLEYGIVKSPALSSWLVWRKWIYDIDNRSAQETGYLFEPILARALGGVPYGQRKSPVKRLNRVGTRQVDCLIDADGEKRAYEFKVRFTIASSGQGRFNEELAFPEEARAAGFTPVLIVLDPTANEKLEILVEKFKSSDGETYLGDEAWAHIAERAGKTMTSFVSKYVRDPIESIVKDDNTFPLADLQMAWDVVAKEIKITVGDQSWTIDRAEETKLEDEVETTEDE